MKEKNKQHIIHVSFSSAFFFIGLFFVNSLLCVLGWLVKIPITSFHFPISIVLTIIINYFIQCKIRKITWEEYLISVGIGIVGIIIALLLANQFMDISYDGSWYHLNSMIRMKEGWNPIYEYIQSNHFGDQFIDPYSCKAFWSFGASVYSLIGNLNSTKIVATIMMFTVFFFSISVIGKLAKSKWQMIFVIVVSFVIACNPVYLSQLYTNYLDSTLGLLIIVYILLFLAMLLKQMSFKKIEFCLLCIMCISLMMNIKLTGLFFAAIFCLLYILGELWKIIKEKDGKYFIKIVLVGVIGIGTGIFIGINPFITNVARGHHIFHPIFGNEKIEVMGGNVPEVFRDRSTLEKLLLANFSQTTNSVLKEDVKFKNPLNFSYPEYSNMLQDTRIGGFGAIFPLILSIMLVSMIVYAKDVFKDKDKLKRNAIWISIGIIVLVAIIFPESWWARYYVPLWILPAFVSIYLFFRNKNISKIIAIAIITLMTWNNYKVWNTLYQFNMDFSRTTMEYIDSLDGKSVYFTTIDPEFKKFELALGQYFKEHNVIAIVNNDENINWDYRGYMVSVKVIEE